MTSTLPALEDATLWHLQAHPAELTGESRSIDVHLSHPVSGVGPDTGILVLNLGFANNPAGPFFSKLRAELANRYDCVCIGVSYMGTGLKPGRRVSLESADWKAVLSAVPRSVRVTLPRTVDPTGLLKAAQGCNLQDKLFFRETIPGLTPGDHWDYGPGQAMDIVWAVIAVRKRLKLDSGRVFFMGSSLSGFLGHLAHKLAPRTFALLYDVSGPPSIPEGRFFKGGRAPFILDGANTSATLLCDNIYSRDPESSVYMSPARLAIRNTTLTSHMHPSQTRIRCLHGIEDAVVTSTQKNEHVEAYRSAGCNAELESITPAEVDGKVFKHAGHSLGANFYPLLSRAGDRWCDPFAPETCRTDAAGDSGQVYEFPVPGGHYVVDHRPTLPRIHFEAH